MISSSASSRLLVPVLLGLLHLHLHIHGTWAVGTDDQVYADIDYGTFQNPSANVRPRFRYWINDASVNVSRVVYDVRSLAHAGAGGLELLGYYLYGDTGSYAGANDAPLQADWTEYGFGGTPWKAIQDQILEAAIEEGIVVDLAQGPNQGAGVPAPYNDDGLLWDLAPFNASVPAGTSSIDMIPGWGGAYNADSLVAAVLGQVASQNANGTQVTLATDSLVDVTSRVNAADGSLSLLGFNTTTTSSSTNEDDDYVLFAIYQEHAEYWEVKASDEVVAAVPQSPITNYQQNGSWVVDHFSAAGAQLIIDFWNASLLTGGNTTQAIRQVGNFLWEDSQEYGANSTIYWTPGLAEAFASSRGYHLSTWLPVILSANLATVAPFGNVTYITDEEDGGLSHIEDYEQTLTELNAEYLTTLTDWANSLGIQFSAQVAYNLPMDMLANIPLVDGPECETLGFSQLIDGYRQFAGPAHLAGKRVISSEAGAVYSGIYQQTVPDLLWELKRSFVGGVNAFVLHGYPFSGDYGNTTWPGFVTFNYIFSEMHGPRQPSWAFAGEWLDWTGRMMYAAQAGVPKADLAFWSKLTSYESVVTQYAPADLLDAGFTYEYLSPDNFDLPAATVDANGTFAPEAQGFRAMIVRANASLTLAGVEKLVEYAQEGLPVVFPGGLPTKFVGYEQAGGQNLTTKLESITALDNVHMVPSDGLAATLLSLGITPRTSVSSNGSWYTHWREDDTTATSYVFVYNDATGVPFGQGLTVGNISFATTDKPFLLDAWTGEKTALSAYSQSETSTTVPLQLAGNQSVIIAFEPRTTGDEVYMESGASFSGTMMTSDGDALEYCVTYNSAAQTIVLSDGSSKTIRPMLQSESTLSSWTLVIEAWGPPEDIFDIEAGASKANSTPYALTSLQPWTEIDTALTNVSGLGYYHTTFDWSFSNSTDVFGAFLDLGTIIHTARLSINGRTVPPLDPTWARADIGAYLVNGQNTVDVVVSTTLRNKLRSVWGELENSGKLATAIVPDPPAVMEYGLVEDVRLIPYRRDVLSS